MLNSRPSFSRFACEALPRFLPGTDRDVERTRKGRGFFNPQIPNPRSRLSLRFPPTAQHLFSVPWLRSNPLHVSCLHVSPLPLPSLRASVPSCLRPSSCFATNKPTDQTQKPHSRLKNPLSPPKNRAPSPIKATSLFLSSILYSLPSIFHPLSPVRPITHYRRFTEASCRA
jgi:hypothetical protein